MRFPSRRGLCPPEGDLSQGGSRGTTSGSHKRTSNGVLFVADPANLVFSDTHGLANYPPPCLEELEVKRGLGWIANLLFDAGLVRSLANQCRTDPCPLDPPDSARSQANT